MTITDFGVAIVESAENRRDLLMSIRDKTFDHNDREHLLIRAKAIDDILEIIRSAKKATGAP